MTHHHDDVRQVLERVIRMTRLDRSVARHLLDEQHDALDPSASSTEGSGSSSDISDPTFRAAMSKQLAGFAYWERERRRAITGVDRAMNDAERIYQRILSQSGRPTKEPIPDAEPRCAGWSVELQSRPGGCGKVLERWKDANGVQHIRSTYLCVGCRKAAERIEREAA